MTFKKLSSLMMMCLFIIVCILAVGCSDDDKPISPIQYSWASLSTGINDVVVALTVYGNQLIASGEFTTAGGTSANNIAAWDGSAWTALGSGSDYIVSTLTVFDGKLITGGRFTTVGGVGASCIAAWDGSSWAPLGTGVDYTIDVPRVRALTVFDTKLITGGFFNVAGGVSANYIAAWNGSSWAPLGTGMDGGVISLTVYDNKLIAGGGFTSAGEVSANRIAAWGPK